MLFNISRGEGRRGGGRPGGLKKCLWWPTKKEHRRHTQHKEDFSSSFMRLSAAATKRAVWQVASLRHSSAWGGGRGASRCRVCRTMEVSCRPELHTIQQGRCHLSLVRVGLAASFPSRRAVCPLPRGCSASRYTLPRSPQAARAGPVTTSDRCSLPEIIQLQPPGHAAGKKQSGQEAFTCAAARKSFLSASTSAKGKYAKIIFKMTFMRRPGRGGQGRQLGSCGSVREPLWPLTAFCGPLPGSFVCPLVWPKRKAAN